MTIQIIVYSLATGRVRRAHDPQIVVPNVLSLLNQVSILPGEGRLIYNKVGSGADTLLSWQLAVSNHTGLIPSPLHPAVQAYVTTTATTTLTTVNDWYCIIDPNNKIVQGLICDPVVDQNVLLSGSLNTSTLLACPQMADSTWTFTPPNTFTSPVVPVK